MNMANEVYDISVAFAHRGEVQSIRVQLTSGQRTRLHRALTHLLDIGHVAAFGIQHAASGGWSDLIQLLRARCGSFVVGACLDPPAPPHALAPSFLMPVWAFDHEIEGRPAATGQLLGLDLELVATPSDDEEHGAHLPGRNGRWLIYARPLLA